eukprot:3601975-Pyramimonas_sp.AAC.1
MSLMSWTWPQVGSKAAPPRGLRPERPPQPSGPESKRLANASPPTWGHWGPGESFKPSRVLPGKIQQDSAARDAFNVQCPMAHYTQQATYA